MDFPFYEIALGLLTVMNILMMHDLRELRRDVVKVHATAVTSMDAAKANSRVLIEAGAISVQDMMTLIEVAGQMRREKENGSE